MKTLLRLTVAMTALGFAGSAYADSNSVFIDQMGDDNISVADQIGTGNTADYSVDGKRNEIGTGKGQVPGKVGALQDGTNLTLNVDQLGNDNKVGTWAVSQRGSNNLIDVTQGQPGDKGFGNTIGKFNQTGDDNKITTVQTGTDNTIGGLTQGSNGSGNRMKVTQDGSDNGFGYGLFTTITPDFRNADQEFGTLTILANTARAATAEQHGDNNRITISQSGVNNGFDVAQGDWGVDAFDNTFNLTQTGSFNFTYGRQYDTNQLANVNQTGFGNVAVVSQQAAP